MFRLTVALAVALASIPQTAFAASRVVSLPTGGLPVLTLSLPGPALPAAALPALPAVPGQNLAVPVIPNVAIPASLRPDAVTQDRGVQAHANLQTAALSAAQLSAQPGSLSGDRARADFVDSPQVRPEPSIPPVEGASAPSPSNLSAPAPRGDTGRPSTPPAPRRTGVRAYLSGVLGAQVANNALVVTLPAILLGLGQSLGMVGFATALTTGLDMTGTLVSGWLTSKLPAASVLTGATVARAVSLAAVAALAAGGALTASLAIGLFAADALARGVADTARNTVPMTLVGKEKPALDSLNSQYQTSFELGGVLGPAMVGLLALKHHAAFANWGVALGFAAAAAAYLFVPRASPPVASKAPEKTESLTPRPVPNGKWLGLGVASTALFSIMPALKGVVPAAFGPEQASGLVLALGTGATLGSFLYNRLHARLSPGGWLALGAAGTLVAAGGALLGGFWTLAGALVVFALLNAGARVALTSTIQNAIPDGKEGGVMGALRFASNSSSMVSRFLLGAAFTAASSPAAALVLIAGGLTVLSGGQLVASRRLVKTAPPQAVSSVHGLPGRLIVVEGLDGSGKSTQLELIKRDLEERGYKVVLTSWNSSEIVSEAVKKAKREKSMTPRVFATLNAADLSDRLQSTILPALQEGAVVLADRWIYTALARDSVRGNDPRWLRDLYKGTIKPDLALYFKAPVDTAISRVMARSGKAGLSEDYEEDENKNDSASQGPKHYEAGLDMKLSEDPMENFRIFQTRVSASYDSQIKEFGLKAIDASKTPDQIRSVVAPLVEKALAGAALRPADALDTKTNLFDKDPAGDAENIRRNYMSEKKGAHFYFRNMLIPMQQRFAELMDNPSMPKVFLHGSPHVDNMAKSLQGAAIVDFDRSRVGPYAWDLVRAAVSVSLRRKKMKSELLDEETARQLLRGYLRGLRHPEKPFSEMRKLKNVEPKADEETMTAYLAANKKWAKEMRSDPLPADAPEIKELMRQYGVPAGYFVAEAGRGKGSMAFREIYLVALRPIDPKSGKDALLLNFKQVRSDADTELYKNPYPTQVQRMMAASELYAPGWDQNQGGAVLGGIEYHARAIPSMNAKLKKMLDEDDQRDFLYAVGTQLGRAHALSYRETGGDPEELEARVKSDFESILSAGTVIRDEIVAAHARYLKAMRKAGLEPKDGGQDDE